MKAIFLILMLFPTFATAVDGQSSATPKKVCVVGNVLKPREVLFDGGLTVTQAIKQAGGIRHDRRDNEVLVISRTPDSQNGIREIYVDLKAIEKKPYKDLDLQDLDIVEVLSRKPDKVREPFVNPCPWVPMFKDRM
jgi:protein involved in polysaccharide export with SLBB domain